MIVGCLCLGGGRSAAAVVAGVSWWASGKLKSKAITYLQMKDSNSYFAQGVNMSPNITRKDLEFERHKAK